VNSPKDVVLDYEDALNRGDLDGLCALFAPDALIWGVLGWGKVEIARPIGALQIHLTVESIVAEGNTVAVRYTERGTSIGAFRG
jgi:ketosteroid isomerase-like protein